VAIKKVHNQLSWIAGKKAKTATGRGKSTVGALVKKKVGDSGDSFGIVGRVQRGSSEGLIEARVGRKENGVLITNVARKLNRVRMGGYQPHHEESFCRD